MSPVEATKRIYGPGAHQPMSYSRSEEFSRARDYLKHFGLTLSEADFDQAIAERFGEGCEYEWARD